jgi:hypothetical protein
LSPTNEVKEEKCLFIVQNGCVVKNSKRTIRNRRLKSCACLERTCRSGRFRESPTISNR